MDRRSFLKATATGSVTPLVLSTALGHAQNAQTAPQGPGEIPAGTIKAIRDRIKPITAGERLERQEKARALMAEQGIDALVFEGGVSLNYFTGVNWGRSERLFVMILPRKGAMKFVGPKFEEARALEQVGSAPLLTWEEDESPYVLIKSVLQDAGVLTGVIGIEETTRFLATDQLGRTVASARLVSGTPVTAGCRSVKSAHELDLMQIANDMTAEVYRAAVPALREGMTEREFAGTVSRLFGQFGVGGGALVLFGEASASPHGMVKSHVLEKNQIVLIDGGCSVEGYESDVTRTTIFGTPTDKMRRVWEIVRQAQTATLAAAKPGVPAEDLDAAARGVIDRAGYGPGYKYFTHRVGHGIGMEGHEWYYLVRGNKRPEVAGNIHSDEPGIYIPGEFGIRLEDELLITENGAKLLLPQAESLEHIFPQS